MKSIFFAAAFLGLSFNLISCAPQKKTQTFSMAREDATPSKPNWSAAAQTNIQIGMLLLKQGDTEMAKENFLRALQQAPNDPESWYAMAYFFESTGNTPMAERDYQKAAHFPNAWAAHNNYGTFLCRQKRYQEGIKEILIAAAAPNYIKTAEAYENAGLCAAAIPDNKNAIMYFQKALQINPRSKTSLSSLAKIYSKMGNKKLADYYRNLAG